MAMLLLFTECRGPSAVLNPALLPPDPNTHDCADIMESGGRSTGVYTVHIDGKQKQVRCDMSTDGGGWLVR